MFMPRIFDKSKVPEGYVVGLGRDHPHPLISHLYQGTYDEPKGPMCNNGANRDGGNRFSIWRGNVGENGICKTCMKRAIAGEDNIWKKEEDKINAKNTTENSKDTGISTVNK